MKRLKKDDRGFSLVEVMVAVIILAIVVTPFLHSFVSTANANSKAKEMHRTTEVARSVMESCKAETLESLATQFVYPKDTDFRILNYNRVNGGTSWVNYVKEYQYDTPTGNYIETKTYEDLIASGVSPADTKALTTSSVYSADGGSTNEFLGQDSGIYYYGIGNVSSDKATYDILVKLDANEYKAGGSKTIAYNDIANAQVPVINENKDALCMQQDSFTEDAISEFSAQFQAKLHPLVVSASPVWSVMTPTELALVEDDIQKAIKKRIGEGLTRKIKVDVDKLPTKTVVKATYEYKYKYGVTERSYTKDQVVFNSIHTGEDLRGLYIYYFPLYGRTEAADVIEINNQQSEDMEVYIFKQKKETDTVTGEKTTDTNESMYNMRVLYNEHAADPTDLSTMAVNFHTNLGINLNSDTGLATPPTIYINGSAKTIAEVMGADVLDKDAIDRVFDLDVSVYKKGAMGSGYPDDMKLVTLSGTKLK